MRISAPTHWWQWTRRLLAAGFAVVRVHTRLMAAERRSGRERGKSDPKLAMMDGVVARIAAELVSRCRELTVRINALEREIGVLVRELAPALLEIPGYGVSAVE
jgi:transposase